MKHFIVKPLYDVRWKFEYSDGKATKYGYWTRDGDQYHGIAAFQDTTNLARAVVEAKDKRTGKIIHPLHCPGQDFCLFKWIRVGKMAIAGTINHKVPSQIAGLTIVTRDQEGTFYVDGKIETKKRDESDKNFHYQGFGK